MLVLVFGKSSGRADTLDTQPLLDVDTLAEWSAGLSAIPAGWTQLDLGTIPLHQPLPGIATLAVRLATTAQGVVIRATNRHASQAVSLIGRTAAGAPAAGASGVIIPAGATVELQLPQGVFLWYRQTPAVVA